eukprot:2928668-Pleurochrysis_carterae.AAC.1
MPAQSPSTRLMVSDCAKARYIRSLPKGGGERGLAARTRASGTRFRAVEQVGKDDSQGVFELSGDEPQIVGSLRGWTWSRAGGGRGSEGRVRVFQSLRLGWLGGINDSWVLGRRRGR